MSLDAGYSASSGTIKIEIVCCCIGESVQNIRKTAWKNINVFTQWSAVLLNCGAVACGRMGFQSSCFDVIVAFLNSHKLYVLEHFFFLGLLLIGVMVQIR